MQDAIIMYENGKAIGGEGHPTNASDITFDNTGTDLVSENAEDAIKEVDSKTGTQMTKLWSDDYPSPSTDYSLSESIENFKMVLIQMRTNSEFPTLYIPVETIKNHYGRSASYVCQISAGNQGAQTFPLAYNSVCFTYFPNDRTMMFLNIYNNANWALKTVAIYGIK